MKHKNIRRECEDLWAKNKYYVLSKSHKAYLEIREYLKEKEVDIMHLNQKIEKVREMEESKMFGQKNILNKKKDIKYKVKN